MLHSTKRKLFPVKSPPVKPVQDQPLINNYLNKSPVPNQKTLRKAAKVKHAKAFLKVQALQEALEKADQEEVALYPAAYEAREKDLELKRMRNATLHKLASDRSVLYLSVCNEDLEGLPYDQRHLGIEIGGYYQPVYGTTVQDMEF